LPPRDPTHPPPSLLSSPRTLTIHLHLGAFLSPIHLIGLPLSSCLFSSNKLLSFVWNRRYIHLIFWPPSRNIPFTNPPHCEFHYSLRVNSMFCSIQT
jgi:hypothetical protein